MKTFERFVCFGFLIIAFFIACNLISCKSVEKTQSSKTDTAKVSKSDSSKTSTYTFSDTTKTDSSTEIHTYTVTIDSIDFSHGSTSPGSIEFYTHIPKGDLSGVGFSTGLDPNSKGPWNIAVGGAKAKGVKIAGTISKQAAVVSKGVSIKSDSTQKNIKSDSAVTKSEQIKTVVKKAHPVKMILGVTLGIIIIGCILYLWLVVYKKKIL